MVKKTLEEAKREFLIPAPPPKELKGYRCEFLTCISPMFDDLPDGWSEFGPSRFPPRTRLAAWCPLHSSLEYSKLHERLLSAAQAGESLLGG